MASMQCHKPAEHAGCHQPTAASVVDENNEHRFSNRVKEMKGSVTKLFNELKHGGQEHGGHNHGVCRQEKKKEGHCMPKMGDHKKKEKVLKKKKKNKECKCSDSSSDSSSSSSESEDEVCEKKKEKE
ncbi:hypothetical protein U1Q18_019743 [Sarracenia purpurea var. burkii]